ncbi:MAG TPA: hypothetical protein VM118_01535 [Acidobacteriota bacterium]|nr:hypothetical protein [Acidobacteriota bacterium]
MVGSDLDRLAQSVRRALDHIDRLEADKRRLETDNSVLQTRMQERLGPGTAVVTDRKAAVPVAKGVTEAREKVLRLIDLLRQCEKEL